MGGAVNLYTMRYRPASFATLPPRLNRGGGLGWWYVEAPFDLAHIRTDIPRSKHVFGVIETRDPLTPQELRDYEIDEVRP